MTYNLRFGEKASLEELAEAIRAQRHADLVALQEIDCRTRRPRASSASTTKTS